ncbi:uncharacterized protein BJ212DRAFT_1300720 [Suillus subaureus]|uniref:DUF659 domain-containing protein n=1 Tax=Suillus subaureus TaxID=48587 RepID=A0A9P7JCL7_9AGAM|nr:uncharacterized protein BJ212DRAFT_1300720 [Suillus subaureus]KAG1814443.1 hypothetical protein BJ212DRAFT_1300720 [Suillus subaureus]
MSDEKHPGGRPPARIITDNFMELEPSLHLTNPKECPDAPSSIRNKAHKVLMQKGAAVGQTEAPFFCDTPALDVAETNSNGNSQSDVGTSTVIKKWKAGAGTLENYVHHTLTPVQQETANIKLFQWEDKICRSLYGSVVAEVGQYPTVLSSTDKYLETMKKVLKNMEIENGKNLIALTTDDPTIMQSFCRKFKSEYYWVITLACFLHGLNTIIRKIASYPTMKNWLQNAQKKTNNLSPVAPEVIKTVLSDMEYWPHLGQFIKTCKPIVDVIGNLELWDAT